MTFDFNSKTMANPIKGTWHFSYSALRAMCVINYSQSLLHQLKNAELIVLQRERECCDFGRFLLGQSGRSVTSDSCQHQRDALR
jgi:hypothetical protein